MRVWSSLSARLSPGSLALVRLSLGTALGLDKSLLGAAYVRYGVIK